jgi:hypothetical protein
MTIEQVAAASGVPAATVRTWSRGTIPAAGWRALLGVGSCERCGGPHHTFEDLATTPYLYVLGVYLGDGTIYQNARCTSLRISCDPKYPALIDEMAMAVEALRGRKPHSALLRSCNCVVITSYWKCWPCLFPQHGAGKKHRRRIILEPWQRELMEQDPRRWHISIARRDSVAKLDEFVGLKA